MQDESDDLLNKINFLHEKSIEDFAESIYKMWGKFVIKISY
jgi:hypothetical protein